MNNKNGCLDENLEDVVKDLDDKILVEEDAYHLSEFFKVFADVTRLRILHLLSLKELCVHEIATILDLSQSSVSHQLKVLRNVKLVKPRKVGKCVYYSLSDDHILQVFANGLEHIRE